MTGRYRRQMDAVRLTEMLNQGCEAWSVPGAQVGLLQGDDRVVVCAGTFEVGGDAPGGLPRNP